MTPQPSLKDRLLDAARRWAESNDAPLSRLGKRVAGDANFFDRLAGGGGLQLGTLERFAIELVEPANWPADANGVGLVPAEVIAFGHAVGVSAAAPGMATVDAGQKDSQEAA